MTDALEGEPIVTAMQGGFAVTWQALGITEDAVAIRMAMFDANGVPRPLPDGSTVITIADNALAAVKPSIVDVDSSIAAAYVDADEGSLVVKAYDDGGTLIGQDVVDDGASGGISEVSLGSSSSGDTGEENELAVVYVRDDHDDQPDYGRHHAAAISRARQKGIQTGWLRSVVTERPTAMTRRSRSQTSPTPIPPPARMCTAVLRP